MTTEVDIANQALGACRARTKMITSFSDNGPEAAQIRLNYNGVRDGLLRAFFWNFAKLTVSLGTAIKTATTTNLWDASQPPSPWLYEYTMPNECIRVRSVLGQPGAGVSIPALPSSDIGPALPIYNWEIATDAGAQVLLTNAPSAIAVITSRIADPDQWDVAFQQAMIATLAAQMAIPLGGDLNLKKALQSDAMMIISQARVEAANEATDSQDIVPDWLRARDSCSFDSSISIGGVVYGGGL